MSHQDEVHVRKNLASVKAILESAVPQKVHEFARHGNAVLNASWLASVALTCWGWMKDDTLTRRVAAGCDVVGLVFGVQTRVTRQGLLKALAACGPELVELMVESLTGHLRSLKGHWTQQGKVNVAVDGSKFAAPRTVENQACFAATGRSSRKKRYRRTADQSKASTVQVLLTVFWHMSAGLPLRWMTSPSCGSERKNVAEMLDGLPRQARLIGDAEYVGYPLWSKIGCSGRSFLVRVGSNLTFLKQLGRYRRENGFVYYWPEWAMNRDAPPIVLRLFQIHEGRKALYLVTNELDMTEELACQLYAARWKIEMFFRTVKQTCERARLFCLRPENVLTELNWTLLGIWHALFAAKQVLVEEGVSLHHTSPVKVVTAFREVLETLRRSVAGVRLLKAELAAAVLPSEAGRRSSKASRNFPAKKKHHRCGKPTIRSPTPRQKRRAMMLGV